MEKATPINLAPVKEISDELADLQAADTWISVPEIARRIGRGETTVRGLLAAGVIPNGKRGSRYYINRASFEAWMNSGQRASEVVDIEKLADAVAERVVRKLRFSVLVEPVGPRRL